MKRFCTNCFLFLMIFSMLFNSISFAGDNNLNLKGEGVLLMDYDSNRILYEKNSTKRFYPASTTKVMTAILAIELGNMDDMVKIDEEVVKLTDGSHIALDYNEEIRLEDLLNALLIASANDAALAIAKHISGSIEGFVELMNAKAKELGAVNTNFVNPNGLHDDNHYTTAYDLYLISKYAMENKSFRTYVSKSEYTIPPTNKKTEARLIHTTNKFLYGIEKMDLDGKIVPIRYNGIKGLKTGTTPEAGSCLISYAQRDGKNMISVILKSDKIGVYTDTYKLLDYGFNNFNPTFLGRSNEFIENLNIENGSLPYVSTVLNRDVYYLLKDDEVNRVEKNLKFKDKIDPPIAKGEVLGSAEYYLDGSLLAKQDIVSTIDIKSVPRNNLVNLLLDKWYISLIVVLITIRGLFLLRKRKYVRSRYSKYS
ncbi:D-alanyl-D-alanine carboxypeptidase family protein [Tissierella creatinophila]|uniref:serine-type D-Ala-D-Ala carboxypeptidase n=1 Tax=Tissierella creatinophila DSM 6911 TaxID=1123403 RepID=A0A1U7M7P6_TISCR|nr:D-alanyl-D-alanine carboxypeptidase family protein [Tissierella creatinophila]OLS03343.1 D-alanyl-D-alanine carboxypeptidase DacF precursor [Tissierella creatinophila DSM 6911]